MAAAVAVEIGTAAAAVALEVGTAAAAAAGLRLEPPTGGGEERHTLSL